MRFRISHLETIFCLPSIGHPSGLPVSQSLTLLPLYTLATMRSLGFRPGMKPDDRTSAFLQFKTLPLAQVGYIHHSPCVVHFLP